MLCERCKKRDATVHYNYSVNGVKTDMHLCNECAEEIVSESAGNVFGGSLFSGLFGSFLGYGSGVGSQGGIGLNGAYKERICASCGMSESELRKGGRLGCKDCYSTFSDIVDAMIGRIHVSREYKGKIPEGITCATSIKHKIEKMRNDMQAAVERQDYEEAARIRDAIKLLEDSKSSTDTDGGEEV